MKVLKENMLLESERFAGGWSIVTWYNLDVGIYKTGVRDVITT